MKGGSKKEEKMLDEMMTMMMMGDVMTMGMEDELEMMGGFGFGMNLGKQGKKAKKPSKPKKSKEDEEWETDSEEGNTHGK